MLNPITNTYSLHLQAKPTGNSGNKKKYALTEDSETEGSIGELVGGPVQDTTRESYTVVRSV